MGATDGGWGAGMLLRFGGYTGWLAVVMYQYLAWLGDGKRSACQLGAFLCFDAYDHDDGNINSALPWFVSWVVVFVCNCAGEYYRRWQHLNCVLWVPGEDGSNILKDALSENISSSTSLAHACLLQEGSGG